MIFQTTKIFKLIIFYPVVMKKNHKIIRISIRYQNILHLYLDTFTILHSEKLKKKY